uniref:FBA_2 domain-containing protein n=1 Tax=Caenorhabditis tropicalis TaxID=1561998 RepID=A0A1I7TAH6_9PELO
MNSKPLTYDSLKTVILYMEPNTKLVDLEFNIVIKTFRFLLALRIPSIRLAEKTVPLKVDELVFVFNGHSISVNGTVYKYDIYQVDCKDKLPYRVSGISELSLKLTCNVDEFGTRDYITEASGWLPGHDGGFGNNLFMKNDPIIIPTNEGRLQRLGEILEIEKQRLDQLLGFKPKNEILSDEKEQCGLFHFEFLNIGVRKYEKKELEILKNEEMLRKAVEHTKDKIKQMEQELVLYHNRSNNTRPKFEIHLIKYREGSPPSVIERVNYTGDLHKAEESLLKFMFSNRLHVIVVNRLFINKQCSLRLPSDLKMRTKNLNIVQNVTSNQELMKSVVDQSYLPLESVTIIIELSETPELDYEFFGIFKQLYLVVSGGWLPSLQSIQNQIVHISSVESTFFDGDQFHTLIRSWVKTKKAIGTCITLHTYFQEDSNAIRILDRVRNEFNEGTVGYRCVNIPMSAFAVLKISHFWRDNHFLSFEMAVVSVE